MNVTFDITLGEFTWKAISLSYLVEIFTHFWNKPECYFFCWVFFGCFCSGAGEKADTVSRWWISAAQQQNCFMQNHSSPVLETTCSSWRKKGLWKQQRSSPEIQAMFGISQPVQEWSEVILSWRRCQEFCSGAIGRVWPCRLHPLAAEMPLFCGTAPRQLHLSSLSTTSGHLEPTCGTWAGLLVSHCRKG